MKKTALPLLAVALIAACSQGLVSCDKDDYRHAITLTYPPSGTFGTLWADQPGDSVSFNTFDSYEVSSQESWITITPSQAKGTINNTYYDMWAVCVTFSAEPNTTGKTRVGTVDIYNYGDDWEQTITASYLQYGWLNVTRPTGQYTLSQERYRETASFELTDSAMQVTDTITFTVYGNWTMECSSDFVTLGRTEGGEGSFIVPLTLEPNETKAPRTATISLTSTPTSTTTSSTGESLSVVTEISLTQKGE